jgi:predicted transcriptional regulator
MKTLSLKLDDAVFEETEQLLAKINKPRNRYINEALRYYNSIQKKKLLSGILAAESKMVCDESMKVLGEFDAMEGYGGSTI